MKLLCTDIFFSFECARLLTVGTTVDEAAFLFYSLDKACESQLLAEAAAANGVEKIIISDKAAAYTAESAQNPVSLFFFPYLYYIYSCLLPKAHDILTRIN